MVDGEEGPEYSAHDLAFSPNGKRVAYIADDVNRHSTVIVDGQEVAHYDGAWGPVFSPDGKHLTYTVVKSAHRYVILDGKEGPPFQEIDSLQFSPDSSRLLYVARAGSGQPKSLVVDGKPGPAYEGQIGFPTFSKDSAHVLYCVIKEGPAGHAFVVVDGREENHYLGNVAVYGMTFSSDSKHFAYIVRNSSAGRSRDSFVVVDGKESRHYPDVGYLQFSPDSGHVAYMAARGDEFRVVRDGIEGKPYGEIYDLVFSPDSEILAYVAYTPKYKKWFIVTNDQEGKSFAARDLRAVGFDETGGSRERTALRFESARELHYLAREGNSIVLINERLAPREVTEQAPTEHQVTCPVGTEVAGVLDADEAKLRETPIQ